MPLFDIGLIYVIVVWILSIVVRTTLIVIVVVLTLRWVFGVDIRRLAPLSPRNEEPEGASRITVNRRQRRRDDDDDLTW